MEVVSAILLSVNAGVGAYFLGRHQEKKEAKKHVEESEAAFKNKVFTDLARTGLLPYFVIGLEGGISDMQVKASIRNDLKDKFERLMADTKKIMEETNSGKIVNEAETSSNG